MNHTLTMSQSASSELETTGYLELIIGPMYSGKTSKLLELYKQFTFCGIKTLVINYDEDTRYSDTQLSTHDKLMIPCKRANILSRDVKEFDEAKVILINEGQFFEDIVEWTMNAVEKYNKSVYICGLDGDFNREKFGSWLNLIPFCDKVTKLHSYCSLCKKKPAIFSHRLTNEKEQKVIGSDNYVPLCRACYLASVL
jgi:thymidine kinase